MSNKLRNLLKQNRHLEEKIFYESRQEDWRESLISRQELSAALSSLATRIIENQSEKLSVLRMLNDLKSTRGRPLASYEKNALQIVEIIFNFLRTSTEYDPKFYHILNSLQLAFTRLALDDLSFLDNPKHVAVQFLEKLLKIGYHFDENAGQLARFFVHAIELLTDRLASREQISVKTFSMAIKRLDEYFKGFEDKSNIKLNELAAEVARSSRQIEADYYTAHLIKTKIEGDEIPIYLLDFFENQLSIVLHKIILAHGVQSKQCQQLLTDMDTISWSISCPIADMDYKTRYEADVADAMRRVYRSFQEFDKMTEYVEAFFVETEELHRKKLDGKQVRLDVMISADIFSDEDIDPIDEPWDQPEEKSYDLTQLTEGSWYYLTLENKRVRSRLVMVNQLTETFYFVNLSGEKLQEVSFSDTLYLSNHLRPIKVEEGINYQHALQALSRELTSQLKVLTIEYKRFTEQKIINAKQRQQMEERARLAVLRKIELERQEKEQERLRIKQEKEELRKKELAKVIEIEQVEARKRFEAKSSIRNLGPGSQVAVLLKGKWMEASLMLISRTTQRYIFADSIGNKLIEPDRRELESLINQEKLKIIKVSAIRKDPLQSLVAQRRQKLAQRY